MNQDILVNESVVSRRIVYLWSVLTDGLSPAQFETGGQPTISVAGLAPWSSGGTLLAINTTHGEYAVRLGLSDVSVMGPGVVYYSSTSALETAIPITIGANSSYVTASTFDPSSNSVTLRPGDYSSTVTVGLGLSGTTAGNAIADFVLSRNVATGGSGTRTVGEALAVLRNKVLIKGSTMTVYGADDTSTSWTASVTTDAATGFLSGIDPA